MAVITHPPERKRPRRTLSRGIIKGSLIGAVIGLVAAAVLVFSLGAVRPTEQLAVEAFLYLGFEAGFAGAIIGGLLAGLSRLRNTR
jgi:fructose-specific phosphotransferase system IIC component